MIGTHIEIILIVTGATTTMALAQFIAPASVSRIIYGATPTEVVGIALVRHWGLLVFLVGVLLIYAAFHPALREPVTIVAALEKTAFSSVDGRRNRSSKVKLSCCVCDAICVEAR